jgi:hypothetical protein
LFSCKGALLLNRLAGHDREAVEESVGDGTCVKQVLYGAQRGFGLHRESLSRLSHTEQICPVRGDQRLTAIRQNQDEIRLPLAMRRPKNLKRFSLKGMASADDRDSLRKVLMMGSVSWFPSTRFGIRCC